MRNNLGFDPNDKNIIQADSSAVRELAINNRPDLKQLGTKIFIILFIASMLLGYLVPVLRVMNN